jgi:hypothetical protein
MPRTRRSYCDRERSSGSTGTRGRRKPYLRKILTATLWQDRAILDYAPWHRHRPEIQPAQIGHPARLQDSRDHDQMRDAAMRIVFAERNAPNRQRATGAPWTKLHDDAALPMS